MEERAVLHVVGGELVHQLGGVKGIGGQLEVAFQGQEAIDGLAADDGVQVATSRQRDEAMGEQFQVPGELAPGAPDAPGDGLNLTQVWSEEGQDSIRLAQLGLFDNDSFGLISSWIRHFYYYSGTNFKSSGFLNPLFIKISLSFKRQALLCAIALSNSPRNQACMHSLPTSLKGSP